MGFASASSSVRCSRPWRWKMTCLLDKSMGDRISFEVKGKSLVFLFFKCNRYLSIIPGQYLPVNKVLLIYTPIILMWCGRHSPGERTIVDEYAVTPWLSKLWEGSFNIPLITKQDKSVQQFVTGWEGDGRGLQDTKEEPFAPFRAEDLVLGRGSFSYFLKLGTLLSDVFWVTLTSLALVWWPREAVNLFGFNWQAL